MSKGLFGGSKSRSGLITWLIVIFLVLDACALALTFSAFSKLDDDSVFINLAGRQRMLSQRMTKTALMYSAAKDANDEAQKKISLEEFKKASDLFDKTLKAFLNGGETLSGEGKPIKLPALSSQAALGFAAQAMEKWSPIAAIALSDTVENNMGSIGNLLASQNTVILDLMNKTTTETEKASQAGIAKLRMIQVGVFALAVLVFVMIVFIMRARYEVAKSQSSTLESMLNGLGAGVLALDRKDRIRFHNKAAEQLFGLKDVTLDGRQITSLMTRVGPDTWSLSVSGDENPRLAKLVIGHAIPGLDDLRLATLIELPKL